MTACARAIGGAAILSALTAGCSPGKAGPAPSARAPERAVPAGSQEGPSDDFQVRLWANQVAQGTSDPVPHRRLVSAGRTAIPVLLDLVARAAPRERDRLLPVLVEIRDPRSIPVLIDLMHADAPEVHAALRAISGKDLGARKGDWSAWWRATGHAIAPEERDMARAAFLKESLQSQQEILRTLVRELSTPSLVVRRDPMGKGAEQEPRRFDTAEPEDIRKRQAALAILEAVLDQGDERNLIYVGPLARQIGEAAAPALRRHLDSPDPACRQAATSALSDLAGAR